MLPSPSSQLLSLLTVDWSVWDLSCRYLLAIAAQLLLRCCWHDFSITLCTFVDCSIIKW
uniref:Uncharacterized protein n=1 Tax=Setaria italica TaxID=4555 RepID=K4AHV7_SETIT